MKKLVLSFAAIGLFFTTAQAQVAETTTTTETEVTTTVAVAEDGFEKIELTELPEAVTTAVTRDFQGATTQEAWAKEKEGKVIYKIKLNVDGEDKKVYADAEGNWIDMKDKKEKKDKNTDS